MSASKILLLYGFLSCFNTLTWTRYAEDINGTFHRPLEVRTENIHRYLRGCLYRRRDVTFAGTGRFPGSRHACIYRLFVPFRVYGKNFAGTFFVPSQQSGIPVRSTGIPAKGWFPLRIIFLRTGTDRKVSFVSSRSELMALTQRNVSVRSCPEESFPKWKPVLKRDNFYHINTPSRFAGTILCWPGEIQIKSKVVNYTLQGFVKTNLTTKAI